MLESRNLRLPEALIVEGDLVASLCRFALANGKKVRRSVAAIEFVVQWFKKRRAMEGLAAGFAEKVATIRKSDPHGFIGWDRVGRPIYLEHISQLLNRVKDLRAEGITREDIFEYRVQLMEYMYLTHFPEASRRASRLVDQMCVILDFSGLGKTVAFSNCASEVFRDFMTVLQKYFPDNVGVMFVCNFPKTAIPAWYALQRHISLRMRMKVHFVPRKKTSFLLTYINERFLPQYLGGQLDCIDEGLLCTSDGFTPSTLLRLDEHIGAFGKERLRQGLTSPSGTYYYGGQWSPKPWQRPKEMPFDDPEIRSPGLPRIRDDGDEEHDRELEAPAPEGMDSSALASHPLDGLGARSESRRSSASAAGSAAEGPAEGPPASAASKGSSGGVVRDLFGTLGFAEGAEAVTLGVRLRGAANGHAPSAATGAEGAGGRPEPKGMDAELLREAQGTIRALKWAMAVCLALVVMSLGASAVLAARVLQAATPGDAGRGGRLLLLGLAGAREPAPSTTWRSLATSLLK